MSPTPPSECSQNDYVSSVESNAPEKLKSHVTYGEINVQTSDSVNKTGLNDLVNCVYELSGDSTNIADDADTQSMEDRNDLSDAESEFFDKECVETKINGDTTVDPVAPDEQNNVDSNEVNQHELKSVSQKEVVEYEDILSTGRVLKKIIVGGIKDTRPLRGDTCKIAMFVYLEEDGDEVLSEEKTFCLQEAEVIQVIDFVVPLMNRDEVSYIITVPEFAYGHLGLKPHIPADLPRLYIKIHLLETFSTPESTSISVIERRVIGLRKKTAGNFWYSRKEYTNAIQCYRKAVTYFDDEELELDVPIDRFQLSTDLQELLTERLNTYNNLAMAQSKMESWTSVLVSTKSVLKIEPNNEKALFRKAIALSHVGNTEEALGILRRVTRLYPTNTAAKQELNKQLGNAIRYRRAETDMSRRMLGLNSKREEACSQESAWISRLKSIKAVLAIGGIGVFIGVIIVANKFAKNF